MAAPTTTNGPTPPVLWNPSSHHLQPWMPITAPAPQQMWQPPTSSMYPLPPPHKIMSPWTMAASVALPTTNHMSSMSMMNRMPPGNNHHYHSAWNPHPSKMSSSSPSFPQQLLNKTGKDTHMIEDDDSRNNCRHLSFGVAPRSSSVAFVHSLLFRASKVLTD